MDNFRDEFNQKMDNFRDEFNQKLDSFRDEFNQKVEKVHDESNQKFDSLNKRVDLLSQVVNNVAIDVAILKTNAPRTMAKSNSSLTVLEKVNDVIKADTMTGTILALGQHLVQFGKVSKSVFDTFDTLTESTDEEFLKQIKMMRKLCSDLVEGWTRFKVNVANDASVKQAFCFFAGRLKKLELHAVAELEKLAMELSDESKSAAESLRESFFVLSTAFNNALAKFAVPSREMSPVLSGDISRLTIRPIKISAHAITVKWYAISRGCMENIPIHKYLLFYTLATDDYNWKKKSFTTVTAFVPARLHMCSRWVRYFRQLFINFPFVQSGTREPR
ncbi:hypothetical protein niasHT_033757 [Heterodera trifolii]|uniref:Uncharacterized protein n=1 Tax=Heterodera trifolii TaxID=157864 RepID=A0ABD2IVU4_9BILA